MALTQFTNDWNDALALKISVGNIKKPTQSFLYGVLDFFLGTLNIDSDKMKAKMDERRFKIWLVSYYNDFFKTCNPKCYPLFYGDLLQPESKKVLEILRFLLNFHDFHNAAKTEIVDTVNTKIELHNHWLAKLNQLKIHQEEAKLRAEQAEKNLAESTQSITELKQLLEELTAKNIVLTQEAEQADKEVYRIRLENIELTSRIDGLVPSIVTEQELETLLGSILDTENAIAELDAIDKDFQSKNKSLGDQIGRLSVEVGKLSEIEDQKSIVESIEKEREEKKNLAELITKFKEFRHQIEDTVGKRKELLENIKFAEAELSSKKCNLTALLQLCLLKEKKMESERKRSSTEAAELKKKFTVLEEKVRQLKKDQDELIAMGAQVVEYLQKS